MVVSLYVCGKINASNGQHVFLRSPDKASIFVQIQNSSTFRGNSKSLTSLWLAKKASVSAAPCRQTRPMACRSTAGFQSGSKSNMRLAPVTLRPRSVELKEGGWRKEGGSWILGSEMLRDFVRCTWGVLRTLPFSELPR